MEPFTSCKECLNCDGNINQACLTIVNNAHSEAIVQIKNDECFNCPFRPLFSIKGDKNSTLYMDTTYSLTLGYNSYKYSSVVSCPYSISFKEGASYLWNIDVTTTNCTHPIMIHDGRNIYLPLIVLLSIVLVIMVAYCLVNLFVKKSKTTQTITDLEIESKANALKALDTFSGLCLILQMFFNYNGYHYWFARHALWNGLNFPDLILPWFLWIVGYSITININRKLNRGLQRHTIFGSICIKSLKLIILGLIISSLKHRSTFKCISFTGPLQQIGIIYFVLATIELIFSKRFSRELENQCMIPEFASAIFQWAIYALLLAFYIAIYIIANAPGCPVMYVGPGGISNGLENYNCTGGIFGFVDEMVLGNHITLNKELYEVYVGRPLNTYGILACLSGSLAMFAGYVTGKTYFWSKNYYVITLKLCIGSCIALFLSGILCGFSKNHGIFPFNHNLMSISLMLFAGSLANIIHLGLAWIIDWYKLWDGKPIYYVGKRVVLIYTLHMILNPTFPIYWLTQYDNVLHCQYVAVSTWAIMLFTAVAAYMDKKQYNIF